MMKIFFESALAEYAAKLEESEDNVLPMFIEFSNKNNFTRGGKIHYNLDRESMCM